MKMTFPKSFVLVALLMCGGSIPIKADTTEGAFPVGWLNLTTSNIILGSYPRLEWKVAPSSLDAQVNLDEDGGFSILRDALMNVRVLGVTVAEGLDLENTGTGPRIEVRVQLNGGGYEQIFIGAQQSAPPGEVAHTQNVSISDAVDFGTRIQDAGGQWSEWHSSSNSTNHVVALRNGDVAPSHVSGTEPSKYLLPYIDPAGKIRIGPSDLLLLMETNATSSADPGFDHQDVAVLVSFNDVFQQ